MNRPGFTLRLLTATIGAGLSGLAAAPSVMESAPLSKLPYSGAAYVVTQGGPIAGRAPSLTGAPFR